MIEAWKKGLSQKSIVRIESKLRVQETVASSLSFFNILRMIMKKYSGSVFVRTLRSSLLCEWSLAGKV